MDTKSSVMEKIFCLLNVANGSEKKPRDYGNGQILYRSEIHAIEAIANHPEGNASYLASVLGITNGAITQIITKLRAKNLVEQYYSPDNKKEVFYSLTDKGRKVNKGHARFHAETSRNIIRYLDSLDPKSQESVVRFLDVLIENWPK